MTVADLVQAALQPLLDVLPPSFKTLAVYAGLALLTKWLLATLYFVLSGGYIWFLRGRKNLARYGKWAIVTGATDGIGKAYAKELATSGLNVLLISRTQAKLDEVAKEIQAKSKGDVQTLAIDFSKPASGIYEQINAKITGLDVGILVNNVGISYEYPEFYLDVPQQRLDELVDLNIVSVTRLTSLVLPGMVERKRGAVINLSSGSALRPTPLLTVYAATKAYVDFFTAGLAREYQGKVFFQSVTPYFVSSKMSKMKASLLTPSASAYARQAVNQIGYEHQTTGFLWHAVIKTVLSALPGWFVDDKVFNLHKGLRVRYLKKLQKDAAKTK